MHRNPVSVKIKTLAFLGIVTVLIITVVCFLQAIDYFFGDGNGIVKGIDVEAIGYKFIFSCALFSILSLLFSIGKKWLTNSLIFLITFVGTLVLVELVVGILIKLQNRRIQNLMAPTSPPKRPGGKVQYQEVLIPDDTFGVKPKPDSKLVWPSENGDSLQFTHDSFSRRLVPYSVSLGQPRTKYSLFLGCSFTYGDGVSDSQTMPFYFSELATNYHAYNYGFLAYSPLQTLARFQHQTIRSQVPDSTGFAVFTYITDHIDRTLPATRWTLLQQGRFPALDREHLTTDGIYRTAHKIRYDVLTWLGTTNLWNYFRIGFPKKHTEAHYKLVVDVIKKSKCEYQKQFKNDNFYVLIFPGQALNSAMKADFKEAGIDLFDYSNLLDLNKYVLKSDPAHPNSESYRIVMKQFYTDLKNAGKL